MSTQEQLEEERQLITAATDGDVIWSEQQSGWGDVGPDLETVERGPVYPDGSQGPKEYVVTSWGHDASGIVVSDEDAKRLAHSWNALPERNAQLQAVLELHTRDEVEVIAGACAEEECDHEDKCPTLPFAICAECHRVAEEADPYFGERGVHVVAYPCPTIRAIEEAGK